MVTLPSLPNISKVERRDSFIAGDLLLHLSYLVDANVGEKVGERLLVCWSVGHSRSPVRCWHWSADRTPSQSERNSFAQDERTLTTGLADGSYSMQFAHPYRCLWPSLVHMLYEVSHASLPPFDSVLSQWNIGPDHFHPVLTPKESQVPHCRIRGNWVSSSV